MLVASKGMSSCNMQTESICCCTGSCSTDQMPAKVTIDECDCGDVIISQDKVLINHTVDFSGKVLSKAVGINPYDDRAPVVSVALHAKEIINSSYDASIFLLNESFLN